MGTFVKFYQFCEDLGEGVHNLNTDTLKVYLTNIAPDIANDAVKADLIGITEENGYTVLDIGNTYTRSGATSTLSAVSKTITASGGTVGPFRYAVIFNDTPTSPADPLVAYLDYNSSATLADTEELNIDLTSIANIS